MSEPEFVKILLFRLSITLLFSISYGFTTSTACLQDSDCLAAFPCFTSAVCLPSRVCMINSAATHEGDICRFPTSPLTGFCTQSGACQLPVCSSQAQTCGYGGVCLTTCMADASCRSHVSSGFISMNTTINGCSCYPGYGGESCQSALNVLNTSQTNTRLSRIVHLYDKDDVTDSQNGTVVAADIELDPWWRCPECRVLFGDGVCQAECWTSACLSDGADCRENAGHGSTQCPDTCQELFNNDVCNAQCNMLACGYDGADCSSGHADSGHVAALLLAVLPDMPTHVVLHEVSVLADVRLLWHVRASSTRIQLRVSQACPSFSCDQDSLSRDIMDLLNGFVASGLRSFLGASLDVSTVSSTPEPLTTTHGLPSKGTQTDKKSKSYNVVFLACGGVALALALFGGVGFLGAKRSVGPDTSERVEGGHGPPAAKRHHGVDASADFDMTNFDTVSRSTAITSVDMTSFDSPRPSFGSGTEWAHRLREADIRSPPVVDSSKGVEQQQPPYLPTTLPGASPRSERSEFGSVSAVDQFSDQSREESVGVQISPMHPNSDPWMYSTPKQEATTPSLKTADSGIDSLGSGAKPSQPRPFTHVGVRSQLAADTMRELRPHDKLRGVDCLKHMWFVSALSGDVTVLRKLAQKDRTHANCVDQQGRCPLHFACIGQSLDAVQFLIEQCGAFPDGVAPGWLGQSPLHTAASLGWSTGIEFLLSQRADPNLRDHQGVTPLMNCAKINSREGLLTLLRSARHALNTPSMHDQSARGKKHPITVQFLKRLDNGEPLNFTVVEVPDKKGWTALHYAAALGNIEACLFLLRHGAQINSQTRAGETPLHLAAREYHEGVIRTLQNHHARVDVLDRQLRRAADMLPPSAPQALVSALRIVSIADKAST